jgi:hypothetical protein
VDVESTGGNVPLAVRPVLKIRNSTAQGARHHNVRVVD